MVRLLLGVTVGLFLLNTSAYSAQREHRAGQPGYHPGGGVYVSQGGRGSRTSKVVQPRPAPNVEHQKNWGIPKYSNNFPSNLRDHRSKR